MAEGNLIAQAELFEEAGRWDMSNSAIREENDRSIAVYFAECGKYPLLSHTEEAALFEELREAKSSGDEALATALTNKAIQHNLRLVTYVANMYKHSDVPLGDLIQEGNLGLMRAVNKFDPSRGNKFATYAYWWIRQTIGRAASQQGRTVRYPSPMIDNGARLRKAENQFYDDHGRDPTLYELAEILGWNIDNTIFAKNSTLPEVSLDYQTPDSRESFSNKIGRDEAPDAESLLEQAHRKELLAECLADLPEREAMILRLRHGIDTDHAHSLQEIGNILGLTRERVRQLERDAIQKMRQNPKLMVLKEAG